MAAIDKTYVHTYAEYEMITDWCIGKSFTLSNGDVIKPVDYLYYHNEDEINRLAKENPNFEFPIWNTPTYLDMWLYKNCPIPQIQNRLKEQYTNIEEYYQEYINFKRPEAGKHFTIIKEPSQKYLLYRIKHGWLKPFWWVEVFIPDESVPSGYWPMVYNKYHDAWYMDEEHLPWTCSDSNMSNPNIKKLARKIRKWKLPIGAKIKISGRFTGQEWEIIIRK